MKTKIKLKKGDMVRLLSGNYRGQEGKILALDTARYRAFVEGVNIVHRHTKPNQNKQSPKGGIIKKEASVHISNLMLIEPGTGKATRTGRRIDEKTGKSERYSKKSGETVK
jgi:large subunit ribosomal protein L24